MEIWFSKKRPFSIAVACNYGQFDVGLVNSIVYSLAPIDNISMGSLSMICNILSSATFLANFMDFPCLMICLSSIVH